MKRPKSSGKKASPIKMPKGSKTQIVRRRKAFKLSNIFKRNKYERRRGINRKYIFFPLMVILPIVIIFFSIKYVSFLRKDPDIKDYQIGDVLGLEGIPEYPNSYFLFQNNLNDSIVKEFLFTGNSAYRLDEDKGSEEIEQYYKEVLPKSGWVLVEEVALGTEDKKYGQYWIKEGKGLRIYKKFKDIWYESITEEEAKNALSNRVKDAIEREMLMASSEKQSLLPDYPWRIEIPKEYIIKYSATGIKDFRAVSFQKLGSSDIVEIFPVSKIGKELDFILEDYCKLKSTEDTKYSIVNTVPISFREYLALKGTVSYPTGILEIAVVPNSYNSMVYVISSTKQNDPLFGYILENITPMDSAN